jgi:C-terminal processing protease CtpA/Prc
MQRLTSSQLIGIYRYYNKQGHFHYIKLFDDYKSTLAYRAGLRNYDRLICLNGINIEHDTLDQITKRYKSQLNLPVQMLVCSPSTYQYYKSNNIIIHSDLPTVQHLKPVFDSSCNTIIYLD